MPSPPGGTRALQDCKTQIAGLRELPDVAALSHALGESTRVIAVVQVPVPVRSTLAGGMVHQPATVDLSF